MSEESTLSESAAEKVTALMREEKNPSLKLRVYVEGGGCSGFQYGFSFEQEVKEDDLTFVQHGVTLVVDYISLQYLLGSEIDFKDDKLNGSRFIIRNPNAKGTCGCGSSFNG
jgi:iron-sulfur cluster insertion protein